MEKELRNKKVLDLHNSGMTERSIATELGIGKSTVNKILNSVLVKDDKVAPKKLVEVKLKGTEERFESFVGYERTNVNEYVHKDSGEVVRIVYIKAKSKDDFGYFVKLGNAEKKNRLVAE